ncbi:hypothetical protein CFK39_10505 [Brachybacterium avium]|uniref:Nucleotidyltransferase n=1 Tax=Brachybacterium avium TaxID=2017485 RepID=A0A220UDU7_9MICO|nr:hypothetical protein [Brachybacterium avium]ASK66170.1 hypothetical protein CFK39_10505 [Brachybacterium avium]
MIDLTGRTDIPVAEEVLAELSTLCTELGLEYIVVGAAARDLVIHALQHTVPIRATEDIDIGVAIHVGEQLTELADRLSRKGTSEHKFTVRGVDIDIIPFGSNEQGREVRFADDHLLDVNGLQEAHATSVSVRMPQGTEIHVASAPAQTALKVLAWRDRHAVNPKDGLDLRVILAALSEAPFDDPVWEDEKALAATDYDIVAAASYHYAGRAAEAFAPADGRAVLDTLHDARLRPVLLRHMRSELAADLLDGYMKGFAAELER